MKKYISEFIGTFVLVVFACGTAAVSGAKVINGMVTPAYFATAAAFGLSIVAMAYSIGTISGCHVNPAVSLGVFLSGRMDGRDFIGYVIAQFLGAVAGAAVLFALIGTTGNLGANGLYLNDIGLSIGVEIILTFVFVLAVLGVTSKAENTIVAGLVIGLSLTLVHLLGIYFTGTSVNPARSFGPAILCGDPAALSCVWVFIAAPLVGGALAAGVYRFITK
jgi:aquaporin Z